MSDNEPIRPEVIWLSPMCVGCERTSGCNVEDGQLWCTEPQDDCPECGLGWTRYEIAVSEKASAAAEPEETDDVEETP